MTGQPASKGPRWAKYWLIAAGIYNLIWGAAVILFPNALFDAVGMVRPLYPQIWQCVGMIVGVYGIGYLAAARDSRRHWPIVLVGLLGKIFGPIGFFGAVLSGDLPPAFGITILTNDLVWWVPFSMMLWDAWRSNTAPEEREHPMSRSEALDAMKDQNGESIAELSHDRTVLLVFARHSGCTFCKAMLHDLSACQADLESKRVHLAIVTMSSDDENRLLADRTGLQDASWVSDPSVFAYRAFGLERGRFGQLFGVREWMQGLLATLRGHLVGRLVGDGFQMPGAFLLRNGEVIASQRHRSASEALDTETLLCTAGPHA